MNTQEPDILHADGNHSQGILDESQPKKKKRGWKFWVFLIIMIIVSLKNIVLYIL